MQMTNRNAMAQDIVLLQRSVCFAASIYFFSLCNGRIFAIAFFEDILTVVLFSSGL
jgi:hypothetical protein